MEPKILIVGGEKGSWQMRGHQLGQAIGAHYTAKPPECDWRWADVVVLVKRAALTWGAEARAWGGPLVWDVLDCWEQPEDNARSAEECKDSVRVIAEALKVGKLIGATRDMARDIGGVYLPHHHRIGLKAEPVKKKARVVAYEGSARYLGSWREVIERACARLGLEFKVNPEEGIASADALIAVRADEWDGWACRHWKSGIKYVNAIAAGRPVLTQSCSAFEEIKPAGNTVDDPADLERRLRAMVTEASRLKAFEYSRPRVGEFSIEAVAKRYKDIVLSVAR